MPLVLNVESEAICWRLTNPVTRFQLVEERLLCRDPQRFAGYAGKRSSVETCHPAGSIEEKIAHTIASNSALEPEKDVLLATELEVLMDLAYANPEAFARYEEANRSGRPVHFHSQLPVNELFVQFLLQKCGFEKREKLVHHPSGNSFPDQGLGQATESGSGLTFLPEVSTLSTGLIRGLFEEDRKEPATHIAECIGFQLIGPGIAYLFHASRDPLSPNSKGFRVLGYGGGFISSLSSSLRLLWPWLPDFNSGDSESRTVAIDDPKANWALLPADPSDSRPNLFSIHHLQPAFLLMDPLKEWFRIAFRSSHSPLIQAGADRFLQRFAAATRGLHLNLPPDFILAIWSSFMLRPRPHCLREILNQGLFPEIKPSFSPQGNLRLIKKGPWPSANWLLTPDGHRTFLRLFAPKRISRIQEHLQ